MSVGRRSRGGPLVALVVILTGWVGARAALWDYAALSSDSQSPVGLAEVGGEPGDPLVRARDRSGSDNARDPHARAALDLEENSAGSPAWSIDDRRFGAARSGSPDWSVAGVPARAGEASVPYADLPPRPRAMPVPVDVAAGHQLLWMAALAKLPMPAAFAQGTVSRPVPAPFYPAGRSPVSRKRWSGDGWLMMRRGGGASLATGAAPATYGASQIGAVVRYQLSEASTHKPKAYVRATAALQGVKDKEVAVGISARPVPSVPVIAAAELRATDQQAGVRLRPAAMVVTELPRFALPLEARGEAYAQAGYVGGRFKTAFADGQIRVDRSVGQLGANDIRAGAGAWAGAQKGASRVDIGPTATVGVPVGSDSAARLGVDWRFRVSGRARPRSGPAITLSAGF